MVVAKAMPCIFLNASTCMAQEKPIRQFTREFHFWGMNPARTITRSSSHRIPSFQWTVPFSPTRIRIHSVRKIPAA